MGSANIQQVKNQISNNAQFFPGISSPYLRHELARHQRDPTHVVLFNFRGRVPNYLDKYGVKVHGRVENSIDGVKYFHLLLQDGKKYCAQEVLVPKKCVLIDHVTVHQDLESVPVHQDLSAHTKPSVCDLNGSELIEVSEADEHWVVRLKQGRKRSRDTAQGCIYF